MGTAFQYELLGAAGIYVTYPFVVVIVKAYVFYVITTPFGFLAILLFFGWVPAQ